MEKVEIVDVLRGVPLETILKDRTLPADLLEQANVMAEMGVSVIDLVNVLSDEGYQLVITPVIEPDLIPLPEVEDDEDEYDPDDYEYPDEQEYPRPSWGAHSNRQGILQRLRSMFAKDVHYAGYAPGMMDVPSMMEEPEAPEMEGEEEEEPSIEIGDLTLRDAALCSAYEDIVDTLGCWPQGDAHYMDESPFYDEGIACEYCVAFCEESSSCCWVSGPIAEEGVCKFWVIPPMLRENVISKADKVEGGDTYPAEAYAYVPDPEKPSTWKLRLWDNPTDKETVAQVSRAVSALSPAGFRGNRVDIPAEDLPEVKARIRAAWVKVNGPDRELPPVLKAETFAPPKGVQEEAKKALEWMAEGKAGANFTDVGRKRASDLAAGRGVSLDTLKRIASYLARHEVDKQGEGWSPGEPGFPSPGRVAWAAWGGDPAKSWTGSILSAMEKGNPSVNEVHVDAPMRRPYKKRPGPMPNAKRTMFAKEIKVGSYVSWSSSGGPARGRVEQIKDNGKLNVPDSSFSLDGTKDDPAILIRIWNETARGWRPTDTLVGHRMGTLQEIEPLDKSSDEIAGVFSKADARKYTLGPWYVPDSYDAHGEWIDPEDLQVALWGYVRSGNRDIRLQHNTDVVAGEWVEALSWPYPVKVPMQDAENGGIIEHEFPAGTVFMGVVWEDWAWEMVKAGKIRGYSMGGQGQRVMVDLPSEGL